MKRDFLKKSLFLALAVSLVTPHKSFLYDEMGIVHQKSDVHRVEFRNDEFRDILLKYQNSTKMVNLIIQFDENLYSNVIEKLKEIDSVKVKFEYREIFSGASVEIASNDLVKLSSIKGITHIEEAKEIKPQMMTTHELVNALKSSPNYEHDGRGMVIAIVDSGIDTKHKDLRLDDDVEPKIKTITKSVEGEYTKKVPHGYNYVAGNHKLIDETEHPHGMHIAGILAGNATNEDIANNEGIDGIAPNAQLLMYRVFSDRADTQVAVIDDTVFAAMEDALKHQADVISLSIGSYGTGKPGDAFYKAVERARDKGVVVVASMGNAGASSSTTSYDKYTNNSLNQRDLATTVSVAANLDVIGVGSTRNNYQINHKMKVGEKEFYYVPVSYSKFENKNYELVDAKKATVDDLKNIDVNNKVAIIGRSSENPKTQFDRLREKGAVGVISYNMTTGRNRDFYETEMQTILTENVAVDLWGATISNNDGMELLEMIKENNNLPIKALGVKYSPISSEHEISGFSSWGSTVDLELKPEIVAPGERIYSTLNHDRYGIMSGTSMSTPVVAGASAILLPRFRTMDRPEDMNITTFTKIMMMNTADPLFDTTRFENSPRQQGAGMLNIQDAFKNNVLITYKNKGAVTLKEMDSDRVEFEVTLQNLGDETENFNIRTSKVLTSGDFEVTKENDEVVKEIHSTEIPNSSITSNVNSITLQPKEVKKVNFVLSASDVENKFVEGFIYFDSETNPSLSIPFFGFRGNWQKDFIIDPAMWNENSKTKLTAIMSTTNKVKDKKHIILGLKKFNDESSEVDPNLIAISSTVNERITGSALLRLAVMRDLSDFALDIVTEPTSEANSLRVIQIANFLEKFRYIDYFENDFYRGQYSSPTENLRWDGKLYNSKVGELTPAPEGQYYFRIKAKNDNNKDYQYSYLPIKIDNTLPTVSVTKENEEYFITATDNNAIWLIDATIDGRYLELEKVSNDKYKILNLNPSKTSDNKLVVEVSDIAGNTVKHEEKVENPFIVFKNVEDVENRRRTTDLEATIDENVTEIEATLNDSPIDVSISGNVATFELNKIKDGTSILKFKLKNSTGEVVFKGNQVINRDVTAPTVNFEVEYEDEDETILLVENGYATIKGTVKDTVTQSNEIEIYYFLKEDRLKKENHKLVRPDEDGNFEFRVYKSDFPEKLDVMIVDKAKRKVERTFYLDEEKEREHTSSPLRTSELRKNIFLKEENLEDNLEEKEDGTFGYIIKIISDEEDIYSVKINGGELKQFEEDEDTMEYELNLKEGANIVDIEGYDSKGKLVYQNKLNFFVDIHAPIFEIPNFRPRPKLEEDMSNAEINGTIYVNSEEYVLEGWVEDNGLEWYLRINDDIVKRGKAWREFGQNREYFTYKTRVEENDIFKFRLGDYHGNEYGERYQKYRIRFDKEKPTIFTDVTKTYKKSATINANVNDNIGIYETKYTVDGNVYAIGTEINEIGEHLFTVIAEDYAGNKHTVRSIFNIIDDLDASLTKEKITEKELENPETWLKTSYGTNAKILKHTEENGKYKIKVMLYNDLDEEKILEYELDIEKVENIFDSISMDKISEQLENSKIEIKTGKWEKVKDKWYYRDENAKDIYKKSWAKINSKWYYFDEESKMLESEWVKYQNEWYFLNSDGTMASNQWKLYEGRWYWLQENGSMASNQWVKVKGEWFWAYTSGKIAENEWVYVSGKWYYAKSGGYIAINTVLNINGKKYRFDKTGALVD